MIEKNFHSQLVETFTLKTLEAMNVMMRVVASHLFLKMFGHVIVFWFEEIQNLNQIIIIVKTLQWNSLTSKISEALDSV